MKDQKIFFLKNLDIYNGMGETREFAEIAKSSCDLSKKKDEILYSPDEENKNIYVVKRGEVELYHFKNGKKIIFDILSPGDVFGNFEINKKMPTHFAVCSKNCYLCITPLDEFLLFVGKNPQVILNLIQKMANRINDYEKRIEISNFNAKDRIIYELKRLKEKQSTDFLGKFFDFPLRITHSKLSDLTFLNRVTVSKTMGELEKEGKINFDKKTGIIEIIEM